MSYIPGLVLGTKGDIASSDGTAAVVVPVGADGTRLTARSTAPPGIAWEGDAAISKFGSIFSMVGPAGAPNATVVYDFTQFDPTKTLALNLIQANQSGNSAYDLAPSGTPTYDYSTKTSYGNGPGPYPYQANVLGGGLTTVGNSGATAIAVTNLGTNNDLRITGAITVEMLLAPLLLSTGVGNQLWTLQMRAAGETEDTNFLYSIYLEAAAGPLFKLVYYAEHGAGVDITGTMQTSLPSWIGFGPQHLVMTRLSTGEVTAYLNGRRVSQLVTPVDQGGGGVIVPTRGANPTQNLNIGSTLAAGSDANWLWSAVKITAATFTDAQVQESYRKSIYGK